MTLLRASVAWHVFALSGSAFHLGLIGLVQFLPALGLTLVAGAVADAYDRKRVMMTAQAIALAAAGTLGLATIAGAATLARVYAAVFAVACASSFDSPAR